MKIFAIKENNVVNAVGYLFYYEKTKEFYIELADGLEEWDVPMLLSSLYKKGERTIGDYWSKMWVSQRIVPSDRQNIGQILRDNKLKRYDEFDLLCLAGGRCEQDDFYVSQIKSDELPSEISKRRKKRIQNITLVDKGKAVVFFKNNVVKICNLQQDCDAAIELLIDGYGIRTNGQDVKTSEELYKNGKTVHLTVNDFLLLIKDNIVNTEGAMKLLNCTRQYISELVKNEVLHPIKSYDKNTMFLKNEVLSVSWT